MAKDTVTLVMNGKVTLADYAKVVGDFVALMNGLSKEVAANAAIDWIVDELEAGSATTTIRGEVENEADEFALEEVVDAYGLTGLALQARRPLPFPSVEPYTRGMLGIMNGRVTSILFQTTEVDAEIDGSSGEARGIPLAAEDAKIRESFGSLRGRVQAMTNRRASRFTLYELGTDRAVSCFYDADKEEKVVAAYGKIVAVEGWIRRNPSTGLATSVRKIIDVIPFPKMDRGDYRQAKGAAPGGGGMSPEAAVRKVRDG